MGRSVVEEDVLEQTPLEAVDFDTGSVPPPL
jgi:hypothetical protein